MPHKSACVVVRGLSPLGAFSRHMDLELIRSPDVLRLLAKDPFPDAPPHDVSALGYDYPSPPLWNPSPLAEWWRRASKGTYVPTFSQRG